jgi:hypothetical protein
MNPMTRFRPLINRDALRNEEDHRFWSDDHQMSGGNMAFAGGDVVFCKIDQVLWFFEQLRLTRKRVILVTGEGDLPCDEFRQQFLPANVKRWFATNVTHAHPRVTALPLGMGALSDPVTLSGDQIVAGRKQGLPRDKWLYVNFRPQTNLSVRQPVFDHFARLSDSKEWITMEKCVSSGGSEEFLHNLLTHRFVLCPPGNGVDTHRMWESLAAGAIPVVLRSQAMQPFKELPILFVDRYEEVTLELLEDASRRISPATVEEPMLQSDFWARKIRAAKQALKSKAIMPWGEWIMESVRYGSDIIGRRIFTQKII